MSYHDTLAAAAHNPVLCELYRINQRLVFGLPEEWKLYEAPEVAATRDDRRRLAFHWHHIIQAAIEQGDPDQAGGSMFQHLDLMEKDLMLHLGLTGEDLPSEAYTELRPAIVASVEAQAQHLSRESSN